MDAVENPGILATSARVDQLEKTSMPRTKGRDMYQRERDGWDVITQRWTSLSGTGDAKGQGAPSAVRSGNEKIRHT